MKPSLPPKPSHVPHGVSPTESGDSTMRQNVTPSTSGQVTKQRQDTAAAHQVVVRQTSGGKVETRLLASDEHAADSGVFFLLSTCCSIVMA